MKYAARYPLFALLAFVTVVAIAVQVVTYTIAKPSGYDDGTAFGTEQLVYVVYNATGDVQLFSTTALTGVASNIPDGVTCLYVRAGVYNVTNNSIVPNTLSNPSPTNCKPAPVAKKVGVPGFSVKW